MIDILRSLLQKKVRVTFGGTPWVFFAMEGKLVPDMAPGHEFCVFCEYTPSRCMFKTRQVESVTMGEVPIIHLR